MKSPPDSNSASALWDIVLARDRALVETKLHLGTQLAQEIASHAGTRSYLAEVEKDRAARLTAIESLQVHLKTQGLAVQTAEVRSKELTAALAASEADRAERLKAIESMQSQLENRGVALHHAEARVRELEQAAIGTQRYLESVEADRAARLAVIEEYQAKLNGAGVQLGAKQQHIEQLETAARTTAARLENEKAANRGGQPIDSPGGRLFGAYVRHLRKVVVLKYHDALLPRILQMSSTGVTVEVFESPLALATGYQRTLHFVGEPLWEWLGSLDSLFNENAYLKAHPDVAAAVNAAILPSGWYHFLLFGQFEGRPAETNYFAGLAEFDAILFHADDFALAESCLSGRLQTHHRLILAGQNPATLKLPADAPSRVLADKLLVIHRPPTAWCGPVVPTITKATQENWPRLRSRDVFPSSPQVGNAWPKISVITVSYNQGEYLEETLRSVLDQNYPNLEYIVVDGGSNDASKEIIQRYSERLTWWVSEKDRGQSHALNKGFQRATGQIFTWLNSDDRLAPGSLFVIADAFLRHQTDMVVGRCARIKNHELIPFHFHRCSLPLGDIVPLSVEGLLDLEGRWLKGHFFHQPEVFFSRDIFERSGGHLREDLYYSMDYDLWVRMARAGARVLAIPEITTLFRQHDQQKTGGNELPFLPELLSVNEAHRSFVPTA